MTNLISNAIDRLGSWFKGLQVQRFLAAVLVAFVLLTTNVDSDRNAKAITNRVDKTIHQGNSDRPKTMGEWNREARQTEDQPGERVQRIAKESAEAVKDWGKVYPDTAERSGVQDAAEDAGRAVSKQVNR